MSAPVTPRQMVVDIRDWTEIAECGSLWGTPLERWNRSSLIHVAKLLLSRHHGYTHLPAHELPLWRRWWDAMWPAFDRMREVVGLTVGQLHSMPDPLIETARQRGAELRALARCPNEHCDNGVIRGTPGVGCAVCCGAGWSPK